MMAENTVAENTVEENEIDKETLISLLKDKGRDIKKIENKNKMLEERYVKIFKENKSLIRDRESLESVLKIIFNKDQDKFTNIETGTYDFNALNALWTRRDEERLKTFNEATANYKTEKAQLEAKVASLTEQIESTQKKAKKEHDSEIVKIVENYKNRAIELEKANDQLTKEIKELNSVIEEKVQENTQLKAVEFEVDSLRAELLMKELHIKNSNEDLNIKGKMKENDRKNEVLRLKYDLEKAQEKIKELETEKEDIRQARLHNARNESTQTETLQEAHSPQRSGGFEAFAAGDLPKPTITRNDSEGSFSGQIGENGQVNQEYLKNVILKLFCYLEGNNAKEAKVLMDAICIMLKMTPQDRERIEDAKKNNSMWSNMGHFLKDTFTTRGEINYYTSSIDSK